MLFQCWTSVHDAGPTFKQQWVNAWCLLGCQTPPLYQRWASVRPVHTGDTLLYHATT